MENRKLLYALNVDEVFSNISLMTKYDIGTSGHEVVVEEDELQFAIEEITEDFKSLLYRSFEPYEEDEEEDF